MFFGLIAKTRWPPWPLIGLDIFDFSSETAERNSTKLDRKQDLNVLYQVFVFGPIRKTRWPPCPLIGWDIFDFSSETAERNSTKLDRKQDLNVLYQVCVFRADRKNKMAALANPPKRWHIVLRCTICGPLGLLSILLCVVRLSIWHWSWFSNRWKWRCLILVLCICCQSLPCLCCSCNSKSVSQLSNLAHILAMIWAKLYWYSVFKITMNNYKCI